MEKLAAFDIGSNAVRMAIAQLDNRGNFSVINLERVPLRLGKTVFKSGKFSPTTIAQTVRVFCNFREIMAREKITRYRAVATSAYRDAANSIKLQEEVYQKSGIKIEEISGDEEAKLVCRALNEQINLKRGDSLLVDIGGGSLEITILQKGEIIEAQSFNIGTVRILEVIRDAKDRDQAAKNLLEQSREQIRKFLSGHIGKNKFNLIGTGGNFRHILKLKRKLYKKEAKYIYPSELVDMRKQLHSTPMLKRAKKFNLKSDRADVILPAVDMTILLTEEVKINKISCPDIGLIDGVLLDMVKG